MSAVAPAPCIGTAWAPRTSRAAFPVTASAFAIAWMRLQRGPGPSAPVCVRACQARCMEDPALQALAAEAMMRRHGVSRAEAIRRLEFQDATAEVDDAIRALLGDRDGGSWFDHDDGGRLNVGVVRRDTGIAHSTVDRLRELLAAHGLSDGTDLVPVDYGWRELADAQSKITDELLDLYRARKISSGLSPADNAVHIDMAMKVTPADRARLQRAAEQAQVRVLLRQTDRPTMAARQWE